MKSTEGINFNIGPMDGKRRKPEKRKPCNLNPLTLEKLLIWIDSLEIDLKVKDQLKKMASTYPEPALPAWQKNFTKHLSKAQSIALRTNPKKVVELGDEESEQDEKSSEKPNIDFDSGYEGFSPN